MLDRDRFREIINKINEQMGAQYGNYGYDFTLNWELEDNKYYFLPHNSKGSKSSLKQFKVLLTDLDNICSVLNKSFKMDVGVKIFGEYEMDTSFSEAKAAQALLKHDGFSKYQIPELFEGVLSASLDLTVAKILEQIADNIEQTVGPDFELVRGGYFGLFLYTQAGFKTEKFEKLSWAKKLPKRSQHFYSVAYYRYNLEGERRIGTTKPHYVLFEPKVVNKYYETYDNLWGIIDRKDRKTKISYAEDLLKILDRMNVPTISLRDELRRC